MKTFSDNNEHRSNLYFYYTRMIEAERDATLLRFFEAFLESIPQLIIQGYFVMDNFWQIHKNSNVNEAFNFGNFIPFIYLF